MEETVGVDNSSSEMHMLWNIFKEIGSNPLRALPRPERAEAFYDRVLVGPRKASTVYVRLKELLSGRPAGEPLTASWVLYAMLREQCVSDGVDVQALLDNDQRNANGRKRNRGAFDPGTNSKKTRGDAADAGDDNTSPVFRILDRCLERPPSRLTDQP